MAKRTRNVLINFRVTEQEREAIYHRMVLLDISNREAYLRKMALDGYIVKLDMPELKELISLLRRSSNNLNQLARQAHETKNIYREDLDDLRRSYEHLWSVADKLLRAMATIR